MTLLTVVQTDSLVLFKNSLLSLLSSWWALPSPGQIVASLKCQPRLLCVPHTPINHMHGGSQLVVVFVLVMVCHCLFFHVRQHCMVELNISYS